MTTEQFVSSLRQLADWYEAHPSMPVPYDMERPMFVFLYGKTDKEVRAILRELGSFKKVFADPDQDDFQAHKQIGEITLKLHMKRETVCKPRVVGKRMVAPKVIPAQEERIIPAHEEEIIEWDCEPVVKAEEGR